MSYVACEPLRIERPRIYDLRCTKTFHKLTHSLVAENDSSIHFSTKRSGSEYKTVDCTGSAILIGHVEFLSAWLISILLKYRTTQVGGVLVRFQINLKIYHTSHFPKEIAWER